MSNTLRRARPGDEERKKCNTQPRVLFPGFFERLVKKAQDAVGQGGPSDSTPSFAAKESIPP